jgi:hypothetical protein
MAARRRVVGVALEALLLRDGSQLGLKEKYWLVTKPRRNAGGQLRTCWRITSSMPSATRVNLSSLQLVVRNRFNQELWQAFRKSQALRKGQPNRLDKRERNIPVHQQKTYLHH